MYYLALFGVAVLGVVFGSFAGAQVWRLRARQLVYDQESGEKIDKEELRRLKPLLGGMRSDRSRCLSCSHVLAWRDLLPVISWLCLGGKCRYCRSPIGWTEVAVELVLGGLFVLSVVFWPGSFDQPIEWLKLAIWLLALVSLAINFIYDSRWFLLVSGLNWLLIFAGALFAVLSLTQSTNLMASIGSLFGAMMILGGLYALLWLVSRGRWVGEGDIYLGFGLALFLGDWRYAFVALLAANLIGTLMVLPLLATGKLGRGSQVPFGPLLMAGFLVAWFFGESIVGWYQSIIFL